MQLFIQFIYYLNGSACIAFGMVASGMATTTSASVVAAIVQPMQSIKITELFMIENHVDFDKFNGIIANGMHSNDAANNQQQMIIQSKQTDQQPQQQQL